MKPTETGLWLFKRYGGSDWNSVIITRLNDKLIVNDLYLGSVPLDQFDCNLKNIEWKRPQINLEGQL